MKQKMSPKQEMARLMLASVSLLLVGLMTTPLLDSPSIQRTQAGQDSRIQAPLTVVAKKISGDTPKSAAKKAKRLVMARR